jgi:hypothetical protein
MTLTLDPKFTLSEALPSEIDEIFHILERAYGTDGNWVEIFKEVNPDEIHQYLMTYLSPRWTLPDITIYKITEVATG